MHVLLKTVVGSKLHRLDTPESDEDVKGVYAATLESLTDPFSNDEKVFDSSERDETMYELRHFARLLVKGNPTVLEALWSDLVVENTAWGAELRMNGYRFLDGHAVKSAHLGYAKSQIQKLSRGAYAEDDRRARKATVAWARVTLQGLDLLTYGKFWPNLQDRKIEGDSNFHRLLERLKFGELSLSGGKVMAELFERKLLELEPPADMVPDYDWIKDFCHRVYTN